MQKIILILFSLIIFHSANSAGIVTISGTLTSKSADSIFFASTLNMSWLQNKAIGRSAVDASGKYAMSFSIDEATEGVLSIGKTNFSLFVEVGDNMVINFTDAKVDSTISFSGKGSVENKFLFSFNKKFESQGVVNDIQVKMIGLSQSAFVKFNDSLKLLKQQMLKKEFKGPNDAFVQYINFKTDYYWANNKVIYPRIISQVKSINFKTIQPDSVYYSFLTPQFIQNEKAFNTAMYVSFLANYHADYTLKDQEKNGWDPNLFYGKEYEFAKLNYTGKVKDVMLANILNQIFQQQKSSAVVALFEDYKVLNVNPNLLHPMSEMVAEINKYGPGKPWPADLMLVDSTGKQVHIADFKGKLVYIDFWASWCGPCRHEMPYSKQLIEKFKGKDVVFLFISIDADGNAWKKAMRQEMLDGIHATSPGNWSSPATKQLNIPSIPRYMFLDRNGNFISNEAPRPSNGAEQLIEEYLAK